MAKGARLEVMQVCIKPYEVGNKGCGQDDDAFMDTIVLCIGPPTQRGGAAIMHTIVCIPVGSYML